MNKEQRENLEQLAEQLEKAEKLLVGEFDFRMYYCTMNCGTAGCAIGEASLMWPGVFPESHWEYEDAALSLFGVKHREYTHLFIPEGQDTSRCGGVYLEGNATRYEVAANIKAFLEIKAREAEE